MKNNFISQKGSIMIEALAMLGLIAMVTPVLYRKAAERTTELEDINVASQIRMVSQAVDAYLKDNYNTLQNSLDTGEITDANEAVWNGINDYLPQGFDLNSASKLFSNFRVGIHKKIDGPQPSFTSAVVANLSNDMTKTRASKIATMVGVAGGLFDDDDDQFHGTQGAWGAPKSEFGFGDVDFRQNSIVAVSNDAINKVVGDVDSNAVLYRVNQPGHSERNRMDTNLTMGGNYNIQFNGAGNIEMNGGDINGVNNFAGDSMTLTGLLTADNADINNTLTAGTVNADNGTIGDVSFPGGGAINTAGNITAGTVNATAFQGGTGDFTTVQANSVTTDGEGITVNGGGNIVVTQGNITVDEGNITATRGTVTAQSGVFDYLQLNGDLDMNNNNINRVGTINAQTGIFNYVDTSGLSADDLHAHNSLSVGGDHKVGEYNRYLYVGEDDFDANTRLFVNQSGIQASYPQASMLLSGNSSGSFAVGVEDSDHTYNNSFSVGPSGMTVTTNRVDDSDIMQFKDGTLVVGGIESNADLGLGSYNEFAEGQYEYNNNNVVISRDGVIRLVAPADSDGEGLSHGFIQARRLVSDKSYPQYNDLHGLGAWSALNNNYSTDDVTRYDAYQINPAYTSVMNDIKLATRGGARLSDILPDYINKGIYIADNTVQYEPDWKWYNESGDEPTAETTSAKFLELRNKMTRAHGCTAADCTASPWMGFIPIPQCPPAYDRVVTIEPFRWKMAQIYHVIPNSDVIDENGELQSSDVFNFTGGTTGGPHDDFHKVFKDYPTYGTNAGLLDTYFHGYNQSYNIEVTQSGDTHAVNVNRAPQLYQANTWLNTTMFQHNKNGNPLGWSVIIGFLYPLHQYSDLADFQNIGGQSGLAWNLFPVLNQEMAAVVRVYCSFNRHQAVYGDEGVISGGDWKWGNNADQSDTPVYKYDQLRKFFMYTNDFYNNPDAKDDGWVSQVNDPSLGYDEAW